MAFTETQKDQIRRYLGYAAGWYDLNPRLESMMTKVGSAAVEQASVESILTELGTIDTAIASASAGAEAHGALKKVDEVEFYSTAESSADSRIGGVRRGNMLIERLRQRFGVPLAGRYFGTAPPLDGVMALG